MRSAALVGVFLVVGCGKLDPCEDTDCVVDTDDTEDTEDTEETEETEDTEETEETEDTEPPVVTYADHQQIVFDTAPKTWQPLSWSQTLWSDTFNGYDVTFGVGANVTGETDVSLEVDSQLVEQTRGSWVQFFSQRKDGGKLDAEASINFPITLTIGSLTLDFTSLIGGTVGLPELTETFPTHIFDTLALSADSDGTTYSASSFHYAWNSGTIDPASWAPYVEIDFDFDILYTTVFEATVYELYPRSNATLIASQDQEADRTVVTTYVGAPGSEPEQVRFDAIAKGTLENELTIDATITLDLWYTSVPLSVTLPFEVDMELGDPASWELTLSKEQVTHDQE